MQHAVCMCLVHSHLHRMITVSTVTHRDIVLVSRAPNLPSLSISASYYFNSLSSLQMHTFKLELLCVVEPFRQCCLSVCICACVMLLVSTVLLNYCPTYVTVDSTSSFYTCDCVTLTHVHCMLKEYVIPGPTVTCVEALWNSRLLYQQPHM